MDWTSRFTRPLTVVPGVPVTVVPVFQILVWVEYNKSFFRSKKEMTENPAKRFCSILRIEDNILIGYRGSDGGDVASIVVPEGVVKIAMKFSEQPREAFCDLNDVITSITLPDTLTDIGECTFVECAGLTSLVIPDSVTSIGSAAFESCARLSSITLPENLTDLGSGAFVHCESLRSITLPNTLTSLADGLFSTCQSLTSVTLPNSLTEINQDAFDLCNSLTSLTLPNTVTRIHRRAFHNCTKLTYINFPDSLISIGNGVFFYCTSLTSISRPHSLNVGKRAFVGCSGLTSVTFRPRSSCAMIAWALSNMQNRSNWLLTTIRYLRNVVRLITTFTFERRDVSSVDPEGIEGSERAFKGCTGLGFDDLPLSDNDYMW